MFMLDLLMAFVVGGFIGHRSGGAGRGLAVLFAVVGVGLPVLWVMLWWPDWYLHYHLSPGSWTLAAWGILVVGFVVFALLGHAVVPGRPWLLPVVGVAVSAYLFSTWDRSRHVGTTAEWAAGVAPELPTVLVQAALGASAFTLALAALAWVRSGTGSD